MKNIFKSMEDELTNAFNDIFHKNKKQKNNSVFEIANQTNETLRSTSSFEEPTIVILDATDRIIELSKTVLTSFVVIDFETTGLDSQKDRVISIGAFKFKDQEPIDSFSTFVNPLIPIPPEATAVNGIKNEMVANAPAESQIMPNFIAFLGDSLNGNTLLVAHNARFDLRFLEKMLQRAGVSANIKVFDTLKYSKLYLKGLFNHKQITVAEHFGIQYCNPHNADNDAIVCGKIACKLASLMLHSEIERIEKEQKDLENKQLTVLEKGVCAGIVKAFEGLGINTEHLKFEKSSGKIISAYFPYKIFEFKALVNGTVYFLINSCYYQETGLKEEIHKQWNENNFVKKVYIENINDIDKLSPIITQFYSKNKMELSSYFKKSKWVEEYEAYGHFASEFDILTDIANFNSEFDKLIAAKKEKEKKKIEAEIKRQEKEKRRLEKAEARKNAPPKVIKRPISQYDSNNNFIMSYESISSASSATGVNTKSIREAANGRQKHAGGFIWKFNDINDNKPK